MITQLAGFIVVCIVVGGLLYLLSLAPCPPAFAWVRQALYVVVACGFLIALVWLLARMAASSGGSFGM